MSLPDEDLVESAVEGVSGRWPSSPQWFSYSSLTELEACPRRWMLSRASYESLWAGMGYPPVPYVASLAGDIVHGALERIMAAFVAAGCESAQSTASVGILKKLGGFSEVISRVLEDVVTDLAKNPRAARRLESIAHALRQRVPDMRRQVQATLARTTLVPRGPASRSEGSHSSALGNGSYPEAQLQVESLKWSGRVDLLTISEAEVRITDYKTGQLEPSHHEQVRIYALLWARDDARNPSGRLATELVLAYPHGDERLAPPNEEELAIIEVDVVQRTEDAVAQTAQRPPVARPAPDVCSFCSVRQLCDDYWVTLPVSEDVSIADFAVVVRGRHGPRSWLAEVERPSESARQQVILRTDEQTDLGEAGTLRILSAHVERDDETGLLVLTLTAASEVFRT